jgi:hypothetical protein
MVEVREGKAEISQKERVSRDRWTVPQGNTLIYKHINVIHGNTLWREQAQYASGCLRHC